MRSLPRALSSLVRSVQNQETVSAYGQGEFNNIIFLHHSTGESLIWQGGIRECFTEAGYNFWDHSFNQLMVGPLAGHTAIAR